MPETLPTFTSDILRDRFLKNASPEVVYAYIEQFRDVHYNYPFSEEFELELLSRDEPIIDLAIAFSTDNEKIWKRLYDRNDHPTTVALFSNANVVKHGLSLEDSLPVDVEELGKHFDQGSVDLLKSLLTNTSLPGLFLEEVFEKKGVCKNLSEDQFLLVAHLALQNPRLKNSKDFNYGMEDAIKAAWSLLITLPVGPKSANSLWQGYQEIREFDLPFDLDVVPGTMKDRSDGLDKWVDEEDEDEKYKLLRKGLDKTNKVTTHDKRKFLEYVFARWHPPSEEKDQVFNTYNLLAEIVAQRSAEDSVWKVNEFLANHENKHVRRGFYAGVKLGTGEKGFEEYKLYLQGGKKDFIENFVRNGEAYDRYNGKVRENFHKLIVYADPETLREAGMEHADLTDFGEGIDIEQTYNYYQKKFCEKSPRKHPIYDPLRIEGEDYRENAQSLSRARSKIEEMTSAMPLGKDSELLADTLYSLSEMIARLNEQLSEMSKTQQDQWMMDRVKLIYIPWGVGLAALTLLAVLFLN